MKVHYRFTVDAPLTSVADFHRRSDSLRAITPAIFRTQFHEAPESLNEGDEMYFTMWAGPLPIAWRARIENLSPHGFIDRQISGPFRRWVHQHRFAARSPQATEVIDEIEFALRLHVLWTPIGIAMALGLPILFAYRARKTREILESQTQQEMVLPAPR